MSDVEPRKGMPSPRLSESEFRRRYLEQFVDPAFDSLSLELDRIAAAAWDAYAHSRKAPRTRKAGSDFADPDYDLSADWLATRERIRAAQRRQLRATQDARRRMVNQVGRPGMNGSGSQEPGIHRTAFNQVVAIDRGTLHRGASATRAPADRTTRDR